MRFDDSRSIQTLKFPETVDGSYAKNVLTSLLSMDLKTLVKNVQTKMEVATVNDLTIPLTINDKDYSNCYVASPYGQYVLYGQDELSHKGPIAKMSAKALFTPLGALLKWGNINRVVSVNNWLFNTNLYPEMTRMEVETLCDGLEERYPHHALMFRSLNFETNSDLSRWLQELGFSLVASRMVYLFDPTEPGSFSSRMYKSDQKLLDKTDYEVMEHRDFTVSDASRIHELYQALYLDKYSEQNVQWTQEFFKLVIETEFLTLVGLKKNGRIDAVAGFCTRNGVMTAPVFGYDPTVPQEAGLYRMISLIVALNAKRRGALLNESSGAGSFKKLRRAVPVMEYSAVKSSHLKTRQKFTWNLLGGMLNQIGVPIMERLEG